MAEEEEAKAAREYAEELAVIEEIAESKSDRVSAIVSCAMLENALKDTICAHVVDGPARRDSLFPPGLMERAIDLGYALGMYTAFGRKNIETVAEIRNKFAHKTDLRSFNDKRLDYLFARLNLFEKIDLKDPDYGETIRGRLTWQSPKKVRFRTTVVLLIMEFRIWRKTREPIKAKPRF